MFLQLMTASAKPFVAPKAINKPIEKKIAVVGGGVAGLTAAHYLNKEGHEVKVFEAESEVGGKVNTFYHEGLPYEMGAVWLGEGYETVQELAEEFDVPYHKVAEPEILKKGKLYSYPNYALTQYNPARMLLSWISFQRFLKKHQLSEPGFAHLADEFHLSTEELTRKLGIWAVCDITSSFMTGCGYGYFESIPGLYLLKLLPMAVNGLVSDKIGHADLLVASFTPGWQQLWKEVAKGLNVKLACPVENIRRIEDDEDTRIEIESKDTKEEFDAVIIAAPLQSAYHYLDIDEKEQELFEKIKHFKYLVTLIEGSDIPHASLMDHAKEKTMGHVNLFAQYNKPKNVYTVYQILPKDMPLDDAKELMLKDIEACGGKFKRIIHQKLWDYFPHVTKEDLDAGFYKDLEQRQGVKNTYYAGGIMNFETVESTASYSKSLVEKFFKTQKEEQAKLED